MIGLQNQYWYTSFVLYTHHTFTAVKLALPLLRIEYLTIGLIVTFLLLICYKKKEIIAGTLNKRMTTKIALLRMFTIRLIQANLLETGY